MRTIKCQICGKEIEVKHGNQKYCPECAKERKKERQRARDAEQYQNNKEQICARSREYYKNNKEKERARSRGYYKNNKVLADREGNNFCIYIHTDPLGKVYVGRSHGEDVETVARQRWGSNGINYTGQKFYDECIAVYGWDNIQHEIIEWNLTYEEVIEREQYWKERYNATNPKYGYNVA